MREKLAMKKKEINFSEELWNSIIILLDGKDILGMNRALILQYVG